jgi:hypothetical protein
LRAIAELYPYYNFAAKTTYRAYQTDNGKYIILKAEYSPVKRFPSEQKYHTIGRCTTVRLSAGPGLPDTLMTHEPVANGDYSNVVGELKGPGINNLSEGDMDVLGPVPEVDVMAKRPQSGVTKCGDSFRADGGAAFLRS